MTERAIGRTLRRWRNLSDLSLTEAGKLFGCSGAKLSMIENAVRPPEHAEVIALGLAYKVRCTSWKPLAERAATEAERRNQERSALDVAQDLDEIYPELSVVRAYGADSIPQLPASWVSHADSDDPVQIEVVVSENAVRKEDSTSLSNLVHLAECGRLEVRVLAESNHDQQATREPFLLLSFLHKKYDDVIVRTPLHTAVYVEDPIAGHLVRQGFQILQRASLEPQESIDFIAEVADGR